jgi:hypothetical protein
MRYRNREMPHCDEVFQGNWRFPEAELEFSFFGPQS